MHPAATRRDQLAEAVACGARLREARLIAEMDLPEAAHALGLIDAEALDAMERGQAMPSLATVITAARVLGTTADYLCGFAGDDSDRNLASALQRWSTARISADIQRVARATVALQVGTLRAMHPTAAEGRRLARQVVDAGRAVATLRKRNPDFDSNVMGGASVVARLARAVDTAGRYLAKLERAKRVAAFKASIEISDAEAAQQAVQEGLV